MVVFAGVGSAVAWPQPLDRILAVVDGHVIMQTDVRAFIELGLVEVPAGANPEPHVVRQLIERRVVLDQVDRFVVAEPPAELVERRMEALRRRFASPADLQATLDRVGLTADDLWQVLADDVRREAYERDRFGALAEDRRADARDEWVTGLLRRAQIRRPIGSFPGSPGETGAGQDD